MAAQARDAHRRGARAASSASSSRLGVTQVRLTGGEPLLRRGLVGRRRAASPALEPRPRIAMTTNGIGPRPARAGRWPTPASTGSTSASTPSTPRRSPQLTRRDRLDDVEARARRPRPPPGLTPVKVNAVAMRGINDDSVADLLAVVPRPRLRAALHRADAARRPARLGPRDDGHRRRDPRAAVRALHADAAAGGRRGSAPAERFLVDGGPATVGIIASVTRAVLRRLRPHPAHRRRPGAQLPVRDDARPTCAGRCATGATDDELAGAHARRDVAQAPRARHRRPGLRPARPADVRHRGLSRPWPPAADPEPSWAAPPSRAEASRTSTSEARECR